MSKLSLCRGWMLFVACLVAGANFCHATGTFQLVSARQPAVAAPSNGGGLSSSPVLSADGRYVVFASTAQNLALATNAGPSVLYNGKLNVFLRDRLNGATTLVSVNLAGSPSDNGDSTPFGISTNGQYVLFQSTANDLVSGDTLVPGTTNINGFSGIFVRDVINQTTTLVSVSTNGGAGNGNSRNPVMTPDGRYVAFVSEASNLVGGDTNGIADVFVHDLVAQTTTLVSAGASAPYVSYGIQSSQFYFSEAPDITPDGRYVTFFSTASNLVTGVTEPAPSSSLQNGSIVGVSGDLYVRDMVGQITTWVSTNSPALRGNPNAYSNTVACNEIISTNGQYIAYETCGSPSSGANAPGEVFRYNTQSGGTDVIATNANVPPGPPFDSLNTVDMTPDGRYVVFVGNTNGATCVYRWDSVTTNLVLVSTNQSFMPQSVTSGTYCNWPEVTADGRYVTFESTSQLLVSTPLAGGTNDYRLYVWDSQSGIISAPALNTNGQVAAVSPDMAPSHPSDDDSAIAYESADASMVPNDGNNDYDVFIGNLTGGANELVSVRQPSMPSISGNGYSQLADDTCVSTNGRYVVFVSTANNLVPNDTNQSADVFMQDLQTGTNILISVNTNGGSGAEFYMYFNSLLMGVPSGEPSVSGDGRYVAFSSWAMDLIGPVYGLVPYSYVGRNVYVRDVVAGTTALVSAVTNGAVVTPGNADSYTPTISVDGRFVLFHSKATNLTPGTSGSGGSESLFLRDLQAATNYFLITESSSAAVPVLYAAMTPDGHRIVYSTYDARTTPLPSVPVYVWDSLQAKTIYTNTTVFPTALAISPDGQEIAYAGPTNITVANLSLQTNWNALSGTFTLVPKSCGLRFSADGQHLVFLAATNDVSGSSALVNVYVADLQDGTNLLVNTGWAANTGNTPAMFPDISPNGRYVVYSIAASNNVYGDLTGIPNLVLYDRANNATILMSVNQWGNSTPNQRSTAAVFSGDSSTLVFRSWASDQLAGDYNQSADLYAFALAPAVWEGANESNSPPGFNATLVPPSGLAQGGGAGQGPTITWPAALRQSYLVQYKDDLTESNWLTLPGGFSVINNQAILTDTNANGSMRFYRIVLN